MRYLIKKIIVLILTMFVISLFTFLAFHIIPGDPARLILGTSASEAKLEALRRQLGTDLPLLIPHLGISIPGFFLSILFMWVFGLVLHLFTPGNYVSYRDNPAGFFRFMFFPALAIAVPQIATLTKYVRTSVLGELDKDYVRTAKGKGSTMHRILYGHVLRNAIVAVIPLIGMMIGSIFSGSIIVEQVFGVPGIGRLLIASVTGRDFPLTQTLVMYVAFVIVITNFIVDILIQLIDPRIRISE